jgi:hypothetical protein
MSKLNSYISLFITATTTKEEQQTMSVSLKTVTTAQKPKKEEIFI